MNENIESVLAALDGFRMSDEMTYSAYSALHDKISLLDDLLKEQEPRVLTLEEVFGNAQKIGFPCWVEDHIEDIGPALLFPAVVTSDDIYIRHTGNDYYEGAIYHWAYNKRLRCWSYRPTEEQREAVKWDDT